MDDHNNSGLKVPDSKDHPLPWKPPPTRWILRIPLILTWIRIALIPLFVFIFYLPIANSGIVCLSIFALASFSDYLDGYLARKWNCTSSFGSFLDPVADKLLVTIALILLSSHRGGILLPICTSIIVSREILISAWREWMTALGKRESVS
ncbi:CDP-diacylglycerol--glycerol-3-phosphate 3-phosphatidyltransferase [Galdieria sulphuraria]|uniref:CDP-diacylglycerol--glycerol-3-phosphate 3-phosphatidyltransferase n=1 Tax=Galdieria sulphuraria TaxID=130081 RepID=M2X8A1_GALSU|nr:CDP-diacylglycerol--glycerol-3-phosphate 3-phosphatidyltransferase [Galdieria sulphuraria]EME32785.1 CDP-diacylglycerol--glycerol-3-phosphate 3-phosphatidyltransferase [Galdieria sulphuraria]|eukprot:XP_005709305.1 CDP-diacylglycerol--glycerol-3-phosphate 3-phosphatidyltransferase [Galdieria sulphuraria]